MDVGDCVVLYTILLAVSDPMFFYLLLIFVTYSGLCCGLSLLIRAKMCVIHVQSVVLILECIEEYDGAPTLW